MAVLITIATLLITATIAAAIITGHHINQLKQELAKIEQAKSAASQNLLQAQLKREAAEGTLALHGSIRTEKLERKRLLEEELAELEEEILPDREIKTADALRQRRLEDTDSDS